MKAWKTALIIVPVALVVCAGLVYEGIMLFAWRSDAAAYLIYLRRCGHRVKPIVSAELVSQEEPIVFFDLREDPIIEGIKVKLTYEDGSSKTVDAYNAKECYYITDMVGGDVGIWHVKGMFFGPRWYWYSSERQTLEPGINHIAMFCVDEKYGGDYAGFLTPNFDFYNPEEAGVAYCMVEVMYMPEGA